MKDYIRDNGKIRNCEANIAKMNWLECWWHLDRRGLLYYLRGCWAEIATGAVALLSVLLIVPLFWLIAPIRAMLIVRRASRNVTRSQGRGQR